MLAAGWYKRQKDKLKRALHVQHQSPASSSSTPNVPQEPQVNTDATGPLSSVTTPAETSTIILASRAAGDTAIATTCQSLPNPEAAHSSSTPRGGTLTSTSSNLPLPDASRPKIHSKTTWSGLHGLLDVLKSGAGGFGPLESAIGGLERCVGAFEHASKTRDDYRELGEKLDQLLGDLAQFDNAWMGKAMTTGVKNLCSGIEAEIKIIKDKQTRHTSERLVEATEDLDTILECYRRIHGHVERLMLNVNLNMWKTLDEEVTDRRLLQLSPSMSGAYNSWVADRTRRRQCAEGTRVTELQKLKDWVRNPSGSAIYWINGMAGTGKTTIAYTLCTQLGTTGELAASFFCTRLMPECRDIQLIFPAIAYQLAQFSYPFRHELSKALGSDQVAHIRELKTQFETLIVSPLRMIRHTLPSRLVVVIDALDECEDVDCIGKVLELLVKSVPDLPMRFLVSSRPEPEIYRRIMDRVGEMPDARLVLHEIDPSEVQHDIEAYLRQELRNVPLTTNQWEDLVKRCGVLFIYASTACRYIKSGEEMMGYEEALDMVLGLSHDGSGDMEKELDKLYTAILEVAFNRPHISEINKNRMKTILGTIICAREPMTTETLARLLGLKNAEHASRLLQPLFSVVNVSETTGIATILHASFPDFMLNSTRSANFNFAETSYHTTLARACLQQIRTNPVQFNICGIQSSYLFDSQIHDMPKRVQQTVSPALLYACRHWIIHLSQGDHSPDLREPVFDFLSVRLLLWMEVLNVAGWSNTGLYELIVLAEWCREALMTREVVELADDARDFVPAYCSQLVGKSTPHLYISVLAFWPSNSPIAKHYIPRTTGLPRPRGTAITRRRLPLLATWYMGSPTLAVCSYPTGSRIAIAVGKKICILDGLTGEALLGPLEGHTGQVTCVSVSPNGLHIASGSDDSNIRVWDATNGKLVTGPWKAHPDKVTSVSFSPDSTRIVSTGASKEIRIWSLEDAEQVVNTRPDGEQASTCTAVFSADGLMVISGDDSNTICFWDAHTGDLISSQSSIPSASINSLELSADGSQFVSASSDGSVSVWDAKTGQQILTPMSIHGGVINQAIFSPDNKYIASCADDGMICLCDARNGELVALLMNEHIEPIKLISFSPDSSHLVSCTGGGSVHVRLIKSPDVDQSILQSSASGIHSASFSPDGSHIVTGARDGSIWLWDVHSGALVMGPLVGHEGYISSVVISPNQAYIASASGDKTIRLWDIKDSKGRYKVIEQQTMRADTLSFTPDSLQLLYGTLVYSIGDSPFTSEVVLISDQVGEDEWDDKVPNYDQECTASSPDGSYLVSVSSDGTIQMRHAQTGQLVLGPLRGHTTPISQILFSPDGNHMVSCSVDDTMCFWPIPRGSNPDIHTSDLFTQTNNPINTTSNWRLDSSGWIINRRGEHLIFVPYDLYPYLLRPEAERLISHRGSFDVDFTGANIGELWTRCYRPG